MPRVIQLRSYIAKNRQWTDPLTLVPAASIIDSNVKPKASFASIFELGNLIEIIAYIGLSSRFEAYLDDALSPIVPIVGPL